MSLKLDSINIEKLKHNKIHLQNLKNQTFRWVKPFFFKFPLTLKIFYSQTFDNKNWAKIESLHFNRSRNQSNLNAN